MNSSFRTRSGVIVALTAVLLAGAGVSSAAARQDPGVPSGPSVSSTHPGGCPLTRIGTQFVRCDNLTGAGVSAPAWVPEG